MTLSGEILLLFAAANGFLSDRKPEDIAVYRDTVLRFFEYRRPEVLARIDAQGDMDAEAEAEIRLGFEELLNLKKGN
jgi:F0F1-type ATP synthase alpha subunit